MLTKKTLCGLLLSLNCLLASHAGNGLLVVTRDTLQGGGVPVTNLNVTKISTNGLRLDFGATASVISFADQPISLQLFHDNKTYLWLPAPTAPAVANPVEGSVLEK